MDTAQSVHADACVVGVVGSGSMGSGIAEVAARSGCQVRVVDTNAASLVKARGALSASLARAEAKGRLGDPVRHVLARVTWTDDLSELADADIVIEAIRESLPDKQELIRQLDALVEEATIIASNTSSLPISRLGAASKHPHRVLGMHFFNPVPSMPLVEVVPSLLTGATYLERARTFAEDVLGKTVITATDRAGFVVNAILVPYLLSAIRSLQNGVASREDIDAGMVGGCGMPMGPLTLCDLIGLDVMESVADSLYREYLDPAFSAPSLLRRHVDAGLLGRKSGRGFYTY